MEFIIGIIVFVIFGAIFDIYAKVSEDEEDKRKQRKADEQFEAERARAIKLEKDRIELKAYEHKLMNVSENGITRSQTAIWVIFTLIVSIVVCLIIWRM